MLDLIGYSTVPEDVAVAKTRLEQLLGLFLIIPWWALLGFALVSTMWLMWVSWPRSYPLLNPSDAQPAQPAIEPPGMATITTKRQLTPSQIKTLDEALSQLSQLTGTRVMKLVLRWWAALTKWQNDANQFKHSEFEAFRIELQSLIDEDVQIRNLLYNDWKIEYADSHDQLMAIIKYDINSGPSNDIIYGLSDFLRGLVSVEDLINKAPGNQAQLIELLNPHVVKTNKAVKDMELWVGNIKQLIKETRESFQQ